MKTLLKKFIILSVLASLILCCKEKSSREKADNHQAGPQQDANEEVEIIPISHATAVLQWDDITIYVDPVGGATAFQGQEKPDLILITDIHGDHFDLATLDSLNTSEAKILVPRAVADKFPSAYTPQLDVLNNGDSKERLEIEVTAIPMYNLREEAQTFHTKGRGNGYVLQKNGTRLYISGDTEDIPEMRSLENIDIALVCMNLPYTMTVDNAADAVNDFKPDKVYPYHYRGKPDVSDVARFKKLVEEANPQIEVVQLDWYPDAPY